MPATEKMMIYSLNVGLIEKLVFQTPSLLLLVASLLLKGNSLHKDLAAVQHRSAGAGQVPWAEVSGVVLGGFGLFYFVRQLM